jgi:hypothetical protein
MCSLGNERYCCDGKCNDNQGRGTCPANQDAGEPLNKEERRFVRLTAVVAFTFWVCLIVAAHSLGQWLGWWH